MTKITQSQLEQALKNGSYEKYEGAVIEYLEDGERTGIKAWADLYEVLGKSPRYEIMKALKTVTIDGQNEGETTLEALNRQLYVSQV